ncbi:MAG: acyltransferase [Saprospiraceae bacterium]|nr:acyltransferase [Saprospiraceae bacterium]
MNRISQIDGFRAIAVLGVLWAHIWMFWGNPAFVVMQHDISMLFSFWGIGVDLFFIISGFCMYLVLYSKSERVPATYYFQFVKKRFLRIAPAFYAALIVYCLFEAFIEKKFAWKYFISNICFVNTWTEIKGSGPHFWSLNTEWHFYLLLPFLMPILIRNKDILYIFISCILFRAFIWYKVEINSNFWNYFVLNRLVEFLCGVFLCKIYKARQKLLSMNSEAFIVLGFLLALIGRILMSSKFHLRTDLIGHLARTLDLPILCIGFAIVILYSLDDEKNRFNKFISNKIFLFIGKYSYSMYLWHWLIAVKMTSVIKSYPINSFIGVNITFIISTIILVPISVLSYTIFEEFYFKLKTIAN